MGDRTGIEWTDATWNPVTGCDKVTPGCDHCYAETIAHRFAGTPAYPDGFAVTLRPERLDQPLRWTRPRRAFVNSMSDLFHKDVPDEYIARVFAIMALAGRHTFQVLTKRHGRMRSLLSSDLFQRWVEEEASSRAGRIVNTRWPLPNVWLGVSVEDQQRADLRIPALLDTPAAVRFLSCEPLLGSVTLPKFCACGCGGTLEAARRSARLNPGWLNSEQAEAGIKATLGIDWVIVGGESGRGARPMHPEWVRALRDQCQHAGVPFYFKQWGEWAERDPSAGVRPARSSTQKTTQRSRPGGYIDLTGAACDTNRLSTFTIPKDWVWMDRVGKKATGRVLDGATWEEYPTG